MRRMVDKIFNQYGTDLILTSGGETKALRGFFRAVNSRSWQSMEAVTTPLGEISRGQYSYIGPAEVVVAEGDTLTLDGRAYLFRRVEPYYYGNEIVYYWGLCMEKGGNQTWGSRS